MLEGIVGPSFIIFHGIISSRLRPERAALFAKGERNNAKGGLSYGLFSLS
jgi:hypothetical protein